MNDRPTSVFDGKDAEILDTLIGIHASAENPLILDCTYNEGRMWRGAQHQPDLTLDIDPAYGTTAVGDFRSMPFDNDAFDVVVFDPPHMPHPSGGIMANEWGSSFGLTQDANLPTTAAHVNDLFGPFMVEAKRVLRPNGIVIAKIADLTHQARYQWQHVALVNEAQSHGLTACDCAIKVRKNTLNSSLWKTVRHLRKAHTYFIVLRNGRACHRVAA